MIRRHFPIIYYGKKHNTISITNRDNVRPDISLK